MSITDPALHTHPRTTARTQITINNRKNTTPGDGEEEDTYHGRPLIGKTVGTPDPKVNAVGTTIHLKVTAVGTTGNKVTVAGTTGHKKTAVGATTGTKKTGTVADPK